MSNNSKIQTIIIPSGSLSDQEICLSSKAPAERLYYQFSLVDRLESTEKITQVSAQPTDSAVVIDQITISEQEFKVRISGGTINTKIGIRFLVTTDSDEVKEFDVALPIAPAGIIESGESGSYVIGNTGPQGSKWEKGKDGTQIIISNRDPELSDAKDNIIWLNDITGDLYEVITDSKSQYRWSKLGNLKGDAGSLIYTGNVSPVVNKIYKTGDLYFNITTNDLYQFSQNQWVKITNLKGAQGDRGFLWFFGKEDPEVSQYFIACDCYLNTTTQDLFVYNGNNWQKSLSLKGSQGAQGKQRPKGDKGDQGPQGVTGSSSFDDGQINLEASKDYIDAYDKLQTNTTSM